MYHSSTLPLYCPHHPARRGTVRSKDGCSSCDLLYNLNRDAKQYCAYHDSKGGEYEISAQGMSASGGYEYGYYDEIDTTPVSLTLDEVIALGKSAEALQALIQTGLDNGLSPTPS